MSILLPGDLIGKHLKPHGDELPCGVYDRFLEAGTTEEVSYTYVCVTVKSTSNPYRVTCNECLIHLYRHLKKRLGV